MKIIITIFILFVVIFAVTVTVSPVFCNGSYIALGYTNAQIFACDTLMKFTVFFYYFGALVIFLIVATLLVTYLSNRRQRKRS